VGDCEERERAYCAEFGWLELSAGVWYEWLLERTGNWDAVVCILLVWSAGVSRIWKL